MGLGFERVAGEAASPRNTTATIGATVTFGWWDSWWFLDTLFDLGLGQRQYNMATTEGGIHIRHVGIAHATIGLTPGVRVLWLYVSAGAGAGISWSLIDPTVRPPRWTYSWLLSVRQRISNNVSLSLFYSHRPNEQMPTLDVQGHALNAQDRPGSIYGLRFEYAVLGGVFDWKSHYDRNKLDTHR
jgi:hypothetical protein